MKAILTYTLGAALLAGPAAAYDLYNESSCSPGAKWGTLHTVKVRLLTESFVDYEAGRGITDLQVLADLAVMLDDIEAVIAEYNSVSGIDLELEYADPILGDDNLDPYDVDDYNNHSIIIGFNDAGTNPAWATHHPDDVCQYTESHVYFRKGVVWTFGPPATTDVDGKYFGGGTSFRAVLLHEMGHAVGLAHPENEYAVMDHGTKAWTRGVNDGVQMELLPDDINGLRALYGNGGANDFDVSLTNTWFLTDAQVPDDDAANQIQNCKVSSRGDAYADRADGLVFCGVNESPSDYPAVGTRICPGAYLQLRYTLNNKTDLTLRVEEQVWLSLDEDLEVNGAAMDLKSPDLREFEIGPERSASLGRMFRVPATAAEGTYRVFARVIPYSTVTGASLCSPTRTSGTTASASAARSSSTTPRATDGPAVDVHGHVNVRSVRFAGGGFALPRFAWRFSPGTA